MSIAPMTLWTAISQPWPVHNRRYPNITRSTQFIRLSDFLYGVILNIYEANFCYLLLFKQYPERIIYYTDIEQQRLAYNECEG